MDEALKPQSPESDPNDQTFKKAIGDLEKNDPGLYEKFRKHFKDQLEEKKSETEDSNFSSIADLTHKWICYSSGEKFDKIYAENKNIKILKNYYESHDKLPKDFDPNRIKPYFLFAVKKDVYVKSKETELIENLHLDIGMSPELMAKFPNLVWAINWANKEISKKFNKVVFNEENVKKLQIDIFRHFYLIFTNNKLFIAKE